MLRDARFSAPVKLALIIVAITALVYAKAVSYGFVMWDDNIHVFQNPRLIHVTIANLAHFWIRPYEALYIPVSYMAFGLLSLVDRSNGAVSPSNEFGTCFNPHVFHFANVVLQSINALLVFLIIRKAVKKEIPAALGALLFAVHPLQVESVAWISELRGLLSGAFGFSSILVYLSIEAKQDHRFGLPYVVAALLFTLSLLAKPSVVMIPFFLLLWQMFYYRKGNAWKELLWLLPWFALSFADVYITHCVQVVTQETNFSVLQRATIILDTYGFYLEKTVWPFQLCTEYGRAPDRMLAKHWEIYTIPAVIVLGIICCYFGRNRRWVWLCVATFVLFLLPVSGIVPFVFQYLSTVADRYVYLAMLSPSFALAFALSELSETSAQRVAQLSAIAAIALCIWRTEGQLAVWKNTHDLFTNAATLNPYDWFPHDRLAYDYLLRGLYPESENEYRFEADCDRNTLELFVNYGLAVQNQGRYADAIEMYNKALALKSDDSNALLGRAQCEAALGRVSASVQDYAAAASGSPTLSLVQCQFGVVLYRWHYYQQAAAEFRRSVELYPDFLPAYDWLALTYSKLGQWKLATDVAAIALARNPNDTVVLPLLQRYSNSGHPKTV